MQDSIRVEMPLRSPSRILTKFKTIGEVRKAYPNIKIHKYIYVDPSDNKLKAANPSDDLPIVENSYITFVGTYDDVIQFSKDATPEKKN